MNPLDSPRIEDLKPGSQFRQYRLLERIGYGGQAVIWSAYDEPANRVVAIKFDQAAELNDTELEAQSRAFEHQARLLTTLVHPHILPCYDYGVIGRLHFTVMPYMAGGSLKDWLASSRLSMQESLQVIAQIASALDYLHQRQIVHRDLKPTNVLMDCHRNVYLADFGLARLLSESTQPLHTGRGTPPYAPPEQHTASKLMPQSDIYSLGILFYELLTDELPWRGEKILGLQQITNHGAILPDPCVVNPEVPIQLVAVLRSLTAANPAARPASAAAALRLLQLALRSAGRWEVPSIPALPSPDTPLAMAKILSGDAAEILRRGLLAWPERPAAYTLNLTHFVLVDAAYQEAQTGLPRAEAHCRFMLHGALLYNQRPGYWWAQVADPEQKVVACVNVLAMGEAAALECITTLLADDAACRTWAAGQPLAAWLPFFSVAAKLHVPAQLEQLLGLLGQLMPSAPGWQAVSLTLETDQWLGQLALSEASYADRALDLIGRLRSEAAVAALCAEPDLHRRMAALTRLSQIAGPLPSSTPTPIRRRIGAERLLRELTANADELLRAYFFAMLGGVLGFGGYVFLSYRLPDYMDAMRWLVALERGIFLGAFAGFGIFVTRAVIHRLTGLRLWERNLAGIVAGGLALLAAFLSYDVLFLDILPTGWILPAGCLLIAASVGLGAGLVKNRWLRMTLSAAGLALSLTLTWAAHLATFMSPLLFYDYTWPPAEIIAVTLLVALPLAVFGNLGALELRPGDF